MKILVLNYEFPPLGGGAAPVSKELAIRMAKKGHHVDVITMKYRNLPLYEIIEGANIYRVKCIRNKMSSCQPWEQLSYIISAKKKVKELMKLQQYDICHTHFIFPTGFLARWVKRKFGLRYVITSHGSDVENYNSKKSNKIMHVLLRNQWKKIVLNSDGVIAPSKYLTKLMEKQLKADYSIIPNGIDINRYLDDGNAKRHRILYVGRLQKSKNVQAIIEAASRIDLKDWVIDIVGDGPYRQELQNLASSYGLSNSVLFHGWIANGSENHIKMLSEASLFISESYFESFGVAVVEAIASGCSVLLSDIEAHRMFVKDSNCFTDPNDIDSLAEKMQQFISGEKAFKANRELIKQYSWDIVTDAYEDFYKRVVGNKV